MTGRYKAYPEYKHSGVEWLKEIPAHWDCKKMKFFLDDLVRGPFGSALKKEFFTNSGVKVYEQKNCIQNNITLGDSYISEDIYRDLNRFTITGGDLLMSCSGTIGKIVEVTEPYKKGIINQALLIMRIDTSIVNKAFFKHIFRSEDVQKQIKDNTQGGAMQNLVATDIFKSVSFTIPSTEEQQTIANFLDHETAKIDTLIAKQEKLIELLKEKRQAVISHAVTKGLNPNAPMKDSGVEWLGEVPEHWQRKSLNYLIAHTVDNRGRTPPVIGQGIPMVEVSQVAGNGHYTSDNYTKFITKESYKQFVRSDVKEDDILFVTVGATFGKTCLVPAAPDFFIAQNVVGFRCVSDVNAKYLMLLLSSNIFKEAIGACNKSSTIDNVKVSDLVKTRMVVPPFKEQIEISNYILTMTEQFELLIIKAEEMIRLVKERKMALISAAVTGKIDVRDWSPL